MKKIIIFVLALTTIVSCTKKTEPTPLSVAATDIRTQAIGTYYVCALTVYAIDDSTEIDNSIDTLKMVLNPTDVSKIDVVDTDNQPAFYFNNLKAVGDGFTFDVPKQVSGQTLIEGTLSVKLNNNYFDGLYGTGVATTRLRLYDEMNKPIGYLRVLFTGRK